MTNYNLDAAIERLNQLTKHFDGVDSFFVEPTVIDGVEVLALRAKMSDRLSNGHNVNSSRLGVVDEASRKKLAAFEKLNRMYVAVSGEDDLTMIQPRKGHAGSMGLAFSSPAALENFVGKAEESLSGPEARIKPGTRGQGKA